MNIKLELFRQNLEELIMNSLLLVKAYLIWIFNVIYDSWICIDNQIEWNYVRNQQLMKQTDI